MIKRNSILSFVALFALLCSCATQKPYYKHNEADWEARKLPTDKALSHTTYLIGDAGLPSADTLEPSLAMLKYHLEKAEKDKTSVVFLGDNIYRYGLHHKKHASRKEDERRINEQLDILANFEGKIVFIPGNHDWKQGKKGGLDFVKRQEKYIESHLNRGNTFLPDKGCPGPEVVELSDDVVMIVIDTQWWLHKHKKPSGERDGCDVKNGVEFLALLKDALKRNRTKKIIVAAHHPMYSNGGHGGNFTFKDHFFPLTSFSHKLYLPMPILGSIYPLYRKLMGDIQDVAHHKYQTLVKALEKEFNEYENLVYVAGHEHNLQYVQKEQFHHIISGSGSKKTFVKHNKQVNFAQSEKGFCRLLHYTNGEVWMEFIIPASGNSKGKIVFRKQLEKETPPSPSASENLTKDYYADSTMTVIAGPGYKAGFLKKGIFGKLHRDSWTTSISVPALDINREFGGLTPIQMGGGLQTKSLRYQGGDGHQYVTRSIQKYPVKIIPRELRETFAADIIQDGIAASHPFAALIVPPLADAAGVFHTNPKLVYLPHDPALGDYLDDFSGMLCLFEERPAGNQSHNPSMGNTKKIVNSHKMIEKLQEDYHHKVDEYAMLRARLFDMVLADWDRHDDQWRWATFKEGKNTIYRPIPRDRDQVFFKQDGLIPNIANRKWAIRKFQSFQPDIRDIAGQNFNARYVDRAYLTELSLKNWEAIADSLKTALTDSKIEEAIHLFPDPIFAVNGEEIISTLKARRDKLVEFAQRYYKVLALEVNVVGSHKDEFFEINRTSDEETEVTVYHRTKKGKKDKDKVIYHRIFKTSETKEIRVYGLEGNDEYHVKGDVKKGIMVRIVAGREKDKIVATSTVKGLKKHTRIYDTLEKKKKKRNKIEMGTEAKNQMVKKSNSVEYDRTEFKYNSLSPVAFIGFNPDDGIFLGGGFKHIKYGFKNVPYKRMHLLKGNYAIATGAFNFDYKFHYPELIGNWDLQGEFDIKAPNFFFNFYGLGNESVRVSSIQSDYRYRMNISEFNPVLKRTAHDIHEISFGPFLQYINPKNDEDDIDTLIPGFAVPADFDSRLYAGASFHYKLENGDNLHHPNRGIRFIFDAKWLKEEANSTNFVRLNSELALYLPMNFLPSKTTLAIRTGGSVNLGEYEFFQSNFLGGFKEFRGLRRNRYGGDAVFYNNADLRIKLFDFNNYVVPIEFGILGTYDYGRVWLDGEDSEKWHSAYGGGLYISPLNSLVITANYSISDDDKIFTIQFGFLF
jgi:calcineurin-like phosphoesterase family protein